MKKITEALEGVQSVAIAGHVRPDGDCVGSCTALYLYLKKWFPAMKVDLFLEKPREAFLYLPGIKDSRDTLFGKENEKYDLFVTVDTSTKERIGVAESLFDQAGKTLTIDHHISNTKYADFNYIKGDISSASEVLYSLLDEDKIDKDIAAAIYTGIIHDTGVFRYSLTTAETLITAGKLMEKGIDFTKIIEESYYQKTYLQNQIMGRVLAESILLLNGKCIVGCLKKKDMNFYGAEASDLEGIVAQLCLTKGIEVAIMMYEMETLVFKVSLRSTGKVDVNKVAEFYGGGGHLRAAGCIMQGSMYDVTNNLTAEIEKQLLEG